MQKAGACPWATGKQRGAEFIEAGVEGITAGSKEEACGRAEVKMRLGAFGTLRGTVVEGVQGLQG